MQRAGRSGTGGVSSVPPVVLCHGPERALADRHIHDARKVIEDKVPGIEITSLDVSTYQSGELLTLTSASLFASEKLLLLTNLEQPTIEFEKDFLEYLENPVEGIWVLATHTGGNKAPKIPRKMRQMGLQVHKCVAPKKDEQKVGLVEEEVRRKGGTIDRVAATSLVAALGSDLSELLAAASQLVFDSGGRITDDHVHTFHKGRVETKPYEVAEALADKNGVRALLLARQAYATGVNPVVIVSVLATKFRTLAKMKAPGVTAAQMKMPPWMFDMRKRQAVRWEEKNLAAAIVLLALADEAVKGKSRTPESAVELAIMKITRLSGY